jgi:hypothetical protein
MRDFQREILANLLILPDYRPSLGSAIARPLISWLPF